MKFGETFMQYLHGDQERFLQNYSHVEYNRLKKVLKNCSSRFQHEDQDAIENHDSLSQLCQYQSCTVCDQMFFNELMKEASNIALCFSSRVRHILDLHVAKGMHKYLLRFRHCLKNNLRRSVVEESKMLIQYVAMNAIAIRKILKKYDKVHNSDNGKSFRSRLRAEHVELLQLPWLIELGAFYLNFNELEGEFGELCGHFSFEKKDMEFVISLMLPNFVRMEYSLTCAVCLETVFNPYALGCGHLFCKSCACSAASVPLFEGLKAVSPEAKCPVCREPGVYANSVHMLELDTLLKRRCKDQWKERMAEERALLVKQSKEYWNLQTQYAIGY